MFFFSVQHKNQQVSVLQTPNIFRWSWLHMILVGYIRGSQQIRLYILLIWKLMMMCKWQLWSWNIHAYLHRSWNRWPPDVLSCLPMILQFLFFLILEPAEIPCHIANILFYWMLFIYLFPKMLSTLWDCTFYLKIILIKLLQNTSPFLMTLFSRLLRRGETRSEICAVKEEILFIIAVFIFFSLIELWFPSVYTSVFIVSQLILKCCTSYKTLKHWKKLWSAEGFLFFNFLNRIDFLFFHSIGIAEVPSPFINIIKALKKSR